MRIAHVLPSFGMGGQERVALDLAIGQKAQGCDVMVVGLAAPPEGPLAADFRAHGIDVHSVVKHGGYDVSLSARLAWHFARSRIDVVHTHNPQPLIYGAPAAKLARARAVHTTHGANIALGKRMMLRRAAALFCDVYVAVSEGTAEQVRQAHDVPERKLRTIPNGIDLSRFHPDPVARGEIRAELHLPADAFVVGTVGRLVPEKYQALLVRALAPYLSPSLQLIIVGDGVDRPEVESAVAALGKNAGFVQLVGARRDTARLYAAFDVFALSSRTEGLPLVLPEAMASGLPVVSTAVGGIPQVISAEVGELVPPGDEGALGRSLSALAREPARAKALGERARNAALQKYSAERMVRDYFAIYK